MAKKKKRTWFPHLHVHDDHSLRDGCSTVETYADNVVGLGGESLCVTNHGQAAGYARQYFACKDRGIKPIFGMEAYVNEHRRKPIRELIAQLKKDARAKKAGAADKLARADAFLKEKFRPSPHAIILARNEEGYKNLVRMSTDSWLHGMYYHPRTDTKFLEEHAEGLIYSTACIGGYIPRMARTNFPGAVKEAKRLQRIFGHRNFFVELMITEYDEQRATNEAMMRLAHAIDAPMICTCDVHYSSPTDSLAQDVLLLMRDKKTLKDKEAGEGVWQFESKDLWWRSKEDVIRTWQQCHRDYMDKETFAQAMRNTYELADSIEAFDFDTSLKLPGIFPNPEAMLKELCLKGYRLRRDRGQLTRTKREYVERLHRELQVINGKGFAEYFVILWDIVKNARELGAFVGPGRGSAAGSLVAYLCFITDVDPLRFDLLFERFLDPNRPDPPDIDMDFDPEHRDLVKGYIEQRYPATATIGSFATFKPKATLNDVGRVFGIDYRETQKLTNEIDGTAADEMTWDEIFEIWEGIAGWADDHPEAFEVVKTIRGLNSHMSKNAAGMLIAPASALDYIPLMTSTTKAGDRMTVTAFPDSQGDGGRAGRELTRMGVLKMDILSVNGINVAPRAVEILGRDHGKTVDLPNLPLDDEAALEIAATGEVPGIFQIDTHATKPILKRVGVDEFMDLAMITALVRPGPLKHGIHNKFAKLKRTGDVWREEVPEDLQKVLYASRGLMILQEDIMWVSRIVAGFSFEEANELRRAASKKKMDKMNKIRERFLAGAMKNGHDREDMEDLWEKIKTFGEYGFCKAHAVAYMLTSYQQLYMLAHHPTCYFAALLQTTERKSSKKARGEEKIVGQMRAAMGRGIRIVPPNLRRGARARFDVHDGEIVYGLRKVKGIGENAAATIEGFGPQPHLEGLVRRIEEGKLKRAVTKSALVNMILCGAMDDVGLGPTIEACLEEDEDYLGVEVEGGVEYRNALLATLHKLRKDKGDPDSFTPLVLRTKEKEALGMAFSWWASNELTEIREQLDLMTIAQAKEDDLDSFALCVEVTRVHVHKGKRGNMAFMEIADETGTLENLTVWSEQYKTYKDHLKKGRLIVIRLRRKENEPGRRQYGRYSYGLSSSGYKDPVESVARIMRRLES